jgi:hypothetical protein
LESALVNQTGLELRSLITPDATLELSLARVTVAAPRDDEVIVADRSRAPY